MEDKKQYPIPKIIHYFWMGGGEKPESMQKCIESWKKNCPDFEIREWNEDNYDVHSHPYMEEAYNKKKWAFVTDYARLDVLVRFGGIYLDTDVEVLKDLSPLCQYRAFIGFENPQKTNDGQGFGCEPGMPVFREMLECYDGDKPFEIINGALNYVESPKLRTKVLLAHGLVLDGSRQQVDGVEVFPVDYFCPLDYDTGRLMVTDNTFSIHHFDSSWQGKNAAIYNKFRQRLNRMFGVERGKKMFIKMMQTKDFVKGVLKNGN
ncbi:glycosyltransferase family 32 protein [Butyrivibrio sp. FCS006]|uniref:glycosyltransferase family 32 protein n=1 Tax=Butyrivibrio sp. FCS006 TaxID=1280684 RepID=UPI00041C98F2|nr:glycosyltransferase [Butyrivibrio sp. FCS006]